jgi:hypothetical protein
MPTTLGLRARIESATKSLRVRLASTIADDVIRDRFVVRQQLLGIFRQAVAAIAKGGVVIVITDTRIEAHAFDDLFTVQTLALSIAVQFIKVSDAQRQIGVSE